MYAIRSYYVIIARDQPFTKEVWSREGAKRVFREIPGLREGTPGVIPDSARCVAISTEASLSSRSISTSRARTTRVTNAIWKVTWPMIT